MYILQAPKTNTKIGEIPACINLALYCDLACLECAPMAKSKKSCSGKTVPVQVDIVSDFACPWCWLGKRYFEQGVKQSGQKVETVWRPYMLDPTVPLGGTPYKAYMQKKFGEGPDTRFKAMREHLETTGPDVGITYRFSEIKLRPNTLRAHQLMRWAKSAGTSAQVSEALFERVFHKLENIGDISVLTSIAEQTGMDGALVSELLNEGRDAEAVIEEIEFYRTLGVSGVPTFIYNGHFAISGAQSPEAHIQAITQAAALPANDI